MIDASKIELATWSPDLSGAELNSPTWTKLEYEGETLCNSMEWVEWSNGNPIQVCLCEGCGQTGCNASGFVHVSRLGSHILWTRPKIRPRHSRVGMMAAELLGRFGAVNIPSTLWHEWQSQFDVLPSDDVFPRTTRSDVLDAWLLGVPAPFRSPDGLLWEEVALSPIDRAVHIVSTVEDRLLACDRTDVATARQHLAEMIDWVRFAPTQPVDGRFADPSSCGALVDTLYLDSEGPNEWHAFACTNEGIAIAFGADTILVPYILGK